PSNAKPMPMKNRAMMNTLPKLLVPRLCLGTHYRAGSACRVARGVKRATARQSLAVARSQAEPENEGCLLFLGRRRQLAFRNQTAKGRDRLQTHGLRRRGVVGNLFTAG